MEMWVAQSPDISTLDIQRATNVWMDAMRAHGNQYVNWGAAWQNGMRRAQGWENERGPQRETVPEKLEGRVSSKTARSMQNAVRAANRIKEISNGT
jgi:hypothetical protein